MNRAKIAQLPDDAAELKAMVLALSKQYDELYCTHSKLHHTYDELHRTYDELNQKYEALSSTYNTLQHDFAMLKEDRKQLYERLCLYQRNRFARKSEKIDAEGYYIPSLFNEIETIAEKAPTDEAEEETITVSSFTRRKRGRKRISDDLPRLVTEYDIPEKAKRCACGAMKVRIGSDIREQIDKLPEIYFVRRDVVHKYACKSCEGVNESGEEKGVVAAPMPTVLVPRSVIAPGLLAEVLVSKFCDHLPLFRQEKIFMRRGIGLSRQTLSSASLCAATQCRRVIELMCDDLRKSSSIGIDETPCQVLGEEGRKNTTKSYMWVFRGGGRSSPIVIYRYAPTRSADVVREMLSGYRGVIQTDGFSGYEALVPYMPEVRFAGCMAHARRKFVDAYAVMKSPLAQSVIAQIAKLYAIEEEIREKELSSEQIIAFRKTHALPILFALKARIEREAAHVPPKSVLGKAMRYFLNQWEKLIVYCEYGFLPIDNNLVENAIRPFVVGRKNWLFSGSPDGAHASSIFYSIIETAKACGHEPYWYLRYLFERLPLAQSDDDIRALLPYHVSPEDIARTVDVNTILSKLTYSAIN